MLSANFVFVLLCLAQCFFALRTELELNDGAQSTSATGKPLEPEQVVQRLKSVRDQRYELGIEASPNARDEGHLMKCGPSGTGVDSPFLEGFVTQAEVEEIFAGSKALPPGQNAQPVEFEGKKKITAHEGKFEFSPAAKALHQKLTKMAENGEIGKRIVFHGTKGSGQGSTMNPIKMAGLASRKSPRDRMYRTLNSIASGGFRYAGRAAHGPGVYTATDRNHAFQFAFGESRSDQCGAVLTAELFGDSTISDNTTIASYSLPTVKGHVYFKNSTIDWPIVCEPVMLFPVSYAIVGHDDSCVQ